MDGKRGGTVRFFVVLDGLFYGDQTSDECDDYSDDEPYENQVENDKMDEINEGENDCDEVEMLIERESNCDKAEMLSISSDK